MVDHTSHQQPDDTGLHTQEAAQAAQQPTEKGVFILPDEASAPGIELAEAVGTPPSADDIKATDQLKEVLDSVFDKQDDAEH